jgi:hypothetical protein
VTAVDPTLVEKPWPFRACPTCVGTLFAASGEQGTVVFTCLGCGARWRYLLGHLQEVGVMVGVNEQQPPQLEVVDAHRLDGGWSRSG